MEALGMRPYTTCKHRGRDLFKFIPYNGRGDRKQRKVFKQDGRSKARTETRKLIHHYLEGSHVG